MRIQVLRFRYITLLSIVYLCLVSVLYHLLWKTHALDKLFDSPGQHGPKVDDEYVQFNFKRQVGPHLPPHFEAPSLPSNSGALPVVNGTEFNHTAAVSLNNSDRNLFSNDTNTHLQMHEQPNFCLHAFYYMWYGNTETDGKYIHWNHRYLPHWEESITKRYPKGRHRPPDDIGATFYPLLGCYSSRAPATMEAHMQQLRDAGIGVISVSWYPPGLSDDEGQLPDPMIPQLLEIAHRYAIKVTLHIEPYRDRTPLTVKDNLRYIHGKYSSHPAFYKVRTTVDSGGIKTLPMIYIYDSYLSSAREWSDVFKTDGENSIRGSTYDCVAIALLVEPPHKQFVLEGGFDGFYTYFASNGFSYGSRTANWKSLAHFAKQHNLFFIPSVGPGYDDTRVRPWNKATNKDRRDGAYYKEMFRASLSSNHGGIVSITSFNEWHEGTQIEPAVPKSTDGFTYLDYAPHSPNYYLQLTLELSQEMVCSAVSL